MSERPIEVGDLVRVVRHHDCGPMRGYGFMFTVERIEPARRWVCDCGWVCDDGRRLAYGKVPKGYGFHPIEWLKRIPPLSELESTPERERVTA